MRLFSDLKNEELPKNVIENNVIQNLWHLNRGHSKNKKPATTDEITGWKTQKLEGGNTERRQNDRKQTVKDGMKGEKSWG